MYFYVGSPTVELVKRVTENDSITVELISDVGFISILNQLSDMKNTNESCMEILALLSLLWVHLLRIVDIPQYKMEDKRCIRTKRMLIYIENHYQNQISLLDIASSACISQSEALHCFKYSLKTTPYKYLIETRLSKAAELLRSTNIPINEIAYRTGFQQQAYFGKCFKEKMQCTPTKYRKMKSVTKKC